MCNTVYLSEKKLFWFFNNLYWLKRKRTLIHFMLQLLPNFSGPRLWNTFLKRSLYLWRSPPHLHASIHLFSKATDEAPVPLPETVSLKTAVIHVDRYHGCFPVLFTVSLHKPHSLATPNLNCFLSWLVTHRVFLLNGSFLLFLCCLWVLGPLISLTLCIPWLRSLFIQP